MPDKLDTRYAALYTAAQEVLRALVVFPATFSFGAEVAIAEDEEGEEADSLMRLGWVRWEKVQPVRLETPLPEYTRYALSEEGRAVAERYVTPEEREAAARRHARYYADLARWLVRRAREGGAAHGEARFFWPLEWPNVAAGQAWAAAHAGEDPEAARLLATYTRASEQWRAAQARVQREGQSP